MAELSREFQIFAKPAGARCNLICQYCYYLEKEQLYSHKRPFRMSEELLEIYIRQHIEASTEPLIHFSWHGGEPTILGLDYFRTIVALQQKYRPDGRTIINGIQTNGTLLKDEWCRFLKEKNFAVGLSLDGPAEWHDIFRTDPSGKPTHERVLRGYNLLRHYDVPCEILCVVNAANVRFPLEVYRYLKNLRVRYITFIPLVESAKAGGLVEPFSVPAEAYGDFLIAIFEEWSANDIGEVKIQIFEEAVRTAFRQEHTLCIFKQTCGGVPVVEHNGDFYSCDFFVDETHRLGTIRDVHLATLLDSPAQKRFGLNKQKSLPRYCRACDVLDMCNGGCPKNRFIHTPDGESGLNYLCAGYKKFFRFCRPFVEQIASLWQRHNKQD